MTKFLKLLITLIGLSTLNFQTFYMPAAKAQKPELEYLNAVKLIEKGSKGYLPTSGLFKGVDKVSVVIETINPEYANWISEDDLKTAVVKRLRSFGMKVMPENDPNYPYVYVNVNPNKVNASSLVCGVTVSLMEVTFLLRNLHKLTIASTWSNRSVCFLPTTSSSAPVKSMVVKLLDEFINNWMAAKP